ncbi:hypothetical protein [Spirosoma lituiforme]
MEAEIRNNLGNPVQLEHLYRNNSAVFKSAFNRMYTDIRENRTAQIWHERLNYEKDAIAWGSGRELMVVLVASLLAGLLAQFPDFFALRPDYFYSRNIAFIVFPVLAAYFAWKQRLSLPNRLIGASVILASALYMNVLPADDTSDTLLLACIHLPLVLWTLLGFAYTGGQLKNDQGRLHFLRYNGDLVVMTTLILIAGGGLTAITLGLFNLIDLKIETFYFQHIALWGLAAAPMVGTYLVQSNPQLVNMVSPVIAKVFTPLVFVTLVIYLIAVVFTGKDPYNNRDFLLLFNGLLVGVMALILFSVAGTAATSSSRLTILLLCGLAIVTILLNGIALSAILFRISAWGLTPNKLAILGGNLLILTNLVLITYRLIKTVNDRTQLERVEQRIVSFLPIYGLWAAVVTFLFPLLFHFR